MNAYDTRLVVAKLLKMAGQFRQLFIFDNKFVDDDFRFCKCGAEARNRQKWVLNNVAASAIDESK